MFDAYLGDVELTTLVLIGSVLIVLPIQLWLCFKAGRFFVRLLPVVVFSVAAVVFVIMAFFTSGWESLGYVFLIFYSLFLILVCGIGWGICAIITALKKKRN